MKLFELAADDLTTAYYDPAQDKISGRDLGDTRKPKLTLRKINRLKKMRALDTLENLKKQDLLAVMYGQPEGDPNAAPGGMPF
jgi:hypothetical protein